MNTNRMRVMAWVLGAIVLSAPLATAYVPSLIFTNLGGQLHILQSVPCGETVNVTTSIANGRMQVTPNVGTRAGGGAGFHLTRLELFFTPFSVEHTCKGIRATAAFREIGVQLAGAVRFTGEAVGAPEDQIYRFTIPKEEFLIFESVVDNAPVQQPQTAYRKPVEDVTGLIDLRQGTAELHVVLASRLRFRAGCVRDRCRIDEELGGTLTTDLRAQIRARR